MKIGHWVIRVVNMKPPKMRKETEQLIEKYVGSDIKYVFWDLTPKELHDLENAGFDFVRESMWAECLPFDIAGLGVKRLLIYGGRYIIIRQIMDNGKKVTKTFG